MKLLMSKCINPTNKLVDTIIANMVKLGRSRMLSVNISIKIRLVVMSNDKQINALVR